ncbi:helix-turn-helix domain-containing protein [Lutibaculum baratangense]|uniref:helix-turn-helix domain-containing protein n=1 Tax=Lutibaculum baratangense TaxID=1358440 RepID=UPI0009DE4604|nr:hypothetical protein [Lutibaculum baratangense]
MSDVIVRPIRNEADYEWALEEISRYFEEEPSRGTPEADRFDVLADLIASYEAAHWPIEPADPVDAIRHRMETSGFSHADLARLLGSRVRASELLKRRGRLSLQAASKLHEEWGIPADALLRGFSGNKGRYAGPRGLAPNRPRPSPRAKAQSKRLIG